MKILQKIANLSGLWTAGFNTKPVLSAGLLVLLAGIGFVGFHYLAVSMLGLVGWQAVVLATIASVAIIVAGLLAERPGFLKTVLHLAVFIAGLVIAAIVNRITGAYGYAIEGWQLWLIYTGLYAAALLLLPTVKSAIACRAHERRREYALLRKARADAVANENHEWKRAMSRVVAVTFIGSCATTAIGFYDAVVEKLDPMWMKLGISVGLSVLAAYIIWTGWEFALKAMQRATTRAMRLVHFTIAIGLLVPMTFAIHTVFGIIGVGGVEGQKAQAMDRLRVLTSEFAIADQKRQLLITKLIPELDRVSSKKPLNSRLT